MVIIIVAAGKGTRFGSDVPKQFLPLAGKAVLLHVVDAFEEVFPTARLYLVLSGQYGREMWEKVSRGRYPWIVLVEGGDTRTESVSRALRQVMRDGYVDDEVLMIHDGARPILNPDMLRRLDDRVDSGAYQACVPAMLPTEALSRVAADGLEPISRQGFRTVQTPQTFRAATIIDCYRQMNENPADPCVYDDDAAVFAAYAGQPIAMVEGDRNNIKITRPADIAIAEILLQSPLPYNPES